MRSPAQQAKAKRECYLEHKKEDGSLECYLCQGRIDPAREEWDADHVVPHTFGGSDTAADNVRPAHKSCHQVKTAQDVSDNARAKRLHDKHHGIIKKKGWWKPPGHKYRWGQNG